MDRLSPEIISRALTSRRFGRPLHYFPEVDSTNDTARRLAAEGAGEGTAVISDRQLRGRGRRGRRWLSRTGEGLCLSVILRPRCPPARYPGLTLLAAAAAGRAIESRAGVGFELKWPNDILLGGLKAGGVLAETGTDRDGESFLVVGIGINVSGEDFPPALRGRATSIRRAGGGGAGRAELAAGILAELEELYRDFGPEGDLSRVLAICRERSATIGRLVRASGGGMEAAGLALGITAEGGLRIRQDDGRELTLSSGEVTLRERENLNQPAEKRI